MISRTETTLTLEDHEKAFTEVCFLLEVLSSTITDVVGNSMPSMAVSAGRHMGKKLPIYLDKPNLEQVLSAVAKQFEAGFELKCACDAGGAGLEVGRCAIREVCANRKVPLGNDLCKMFHYYVAGITAELLGKPVRAAAFEAGERCSLRLDVK